MRRAPSFVPSFLRCSLLFLALAGHLALGPVAPAAAHKFYASLAEVEYNPSERVVEIAIRVFPDDLEAALGRKAGRRVTLDAEKGIDRLVLDYLKERFVVTGADGQPLALVWVGMETSVNSVWVYAQAEAPSGLAGGSVRDEIFFELFDDQVNTVNVVDGDRRGTLVFKPGTPALPVAW